MTIIVTAISMEKERSRVQLLCVPRDALAKATLPTCLKSRLFYVLQNYALA